MRHVKLLVGRLAPWVCLFVLPSLAFGVETADLLKKIEQHYNRAKSLEVLFSQTYTPQGGRSRTESGKLFLKKPGRMRWDYQQPKDKLFLSDGKYVYLYTPAADRVEKMSMKETEDMRAPLAFLLGKLDFWRDFQRFVFRPDGPDTRINAEPKSNRLPYTKVEFVVTPDYEIRYLQITGQDHSVMEFEFARETINPPLPEKMFHFQPPPGVEVVDTSDEPQGAY